MKSLRDPFLCSTLFAAAIISGCGTSYMEMNRMVGYVGAQRGKMYVVSIEGKDAGKFQDQLYEALAADGHFEAERYGVTPPPNLDSATNVPSIVLSGIHSSNQSTRFFTEGSGRDARKYKERTESHEFQYSIRDAVTGEELEANVIRQENVGAKEEDKGFLDTVLGDAVKGLVEDVVGVETAHRKALIREFVAKLRLHPEKRLMGLFEEKDIPELKEGVELARKGQWRAAIAKFQAGAENHPISEALHKAYFNLGVAFEYSHDFDKALASLRLADELAPQEGYENEIEHCKWFARQYRWQQKHAGSSSDPAK
jgi:tetratricopeptide (TPR) repeat protein